MPEATSNTQSNLKQISAELRSLYLADSSPWLVGFSGGKDSTLVAQLIFEAVRTIPEEQRKK
jgi:DNA sulfur modification protein DndC